MVKHHLQELIEEISEDTSFDVRSYSGHGMYGKSCLAVNCDSEPLALFAALLRYLDDTGLEDSED